MDTIKIYKRNGVERSTVPVESGSKLIVKADAENIVELNFKLPNYVPVSITDFISVFGKKYFVNIQPNIKKLSSNLYEYRVIAENQIYNLSKVAFLDTDATGIHMSHEFYLTGKLSAFLDVLRNNINRVLGESWDIINHYTDEVEVKTLGFSENNCLQVLRKICDEFGVFYDFEELANQFTINFREQTGYLNPFIFEVGKGKGLYELSLLNASDNNLTTRLYAFGSSRNLGPNYRNYSTRLKLPGTVSGTPDIEVNIDEIELIDSWWRVYGQTDAWNVKLQLFIDGNWIEYGETLPGSVFNVHYFAYPSLIQPTNVRLKAWNVPGKYIYSDLTNEGWDMQISGESYIDNVEAIEQYGVIEKINIWDDIFPSRTGIAEDPNGNKFTDSEMFDLNEMDFKEHLYMLPGIKPKVSFKTGNLAGYEFEVIEFIGKTFTLQSITDERGLVIPSETSTAFQIQEGDEYVLLDVKLPDEYIEAAENRLLEAATEWLSLYSNPQKQYNLSIDPLFIRGKQFRFNPFDRVHIYDAVMGVNIHQQIVELERDLVLEDKISLKISDFVSHRKLRKNLRQDNFNKMANQLTYIDNRTSYFNALRARGQDILAGDTSIIFTTNLR